MKEHFIPSKGGGLFYPLIRGDSYNDFSHMSINISSTMDVIKKYIMNKIRCFQYREPFTNLYKKTKRKWFFNPGKILEENVRFV
jgi:hypothetical protein